MGRINILDKAVAELIAAGEVVERPASIVKELVENAIDAGSTAITVEIAGGGVRLIRVSDDGSGIEREDVPKAFLRHATSKIRSAEDLDGIYTLGFRGEALASIAAVSRVTLTTKTAQDTEGVAYEMEGGVFVREAPAGCPDGTSIVVRDVFFNTPARMKFLKKDVGEGNAVAQVVDKCALSHPEIAFRFVRDGQTKLQTSGNGNLLSVIHSIYGGDLSQKMLPVDYILDGAVHVSGFIGHPAAARPSRAYQNFFLNNRYIRTRTGSAALEEGFKTKLMGGRYPSCVLNLEVLAQNVDVNVHPAKIEVRFADEKPIFSAVFYAVKSALARMETPLGHPGAEAGTPHKTKLNELTLHLPQEEYVQPRITEPPNAGARMTAQEYRRAFVPQAQEKIETEIETEAAAPPLQTDFNKPLRLNASKLDIFVEDEENRHPRPYYAVKAANEEKKDAAAEKYEKNPVNANKNATVLPEHDTIVNSEKKEESLPPAQTGEPYRIAGELFGTYIVLEQGRDMVLVDKHAAHERLIYEKIIQNIAYGNRQVLLTPVAVTLAREEYTAALENEEAFAQMGFGVEDFGDGTLMVREIPIELGEKDVPGIVGEMAARLLRGNKSLTPEVLDRLYYSIACKSALRAGDKNNTWELAEIVRRLEENPQITHCPHGRPVTVRLSRYELEKMFGRIV